MPETRSHKEAKLKAAGKSGRTEAPLKSGRRVDATTKVRVVEVERSGTLAGLQKAASKLKESRQPQKVLQVPSTHMPKARKAMREVGVTGTVKNLGGTKATYVGASRGTPKHVSRSPRAKRSK